MSSRRSVCSVLAAAAAFALLCTNASCRYSLPLVPTQPPPDAWLEVPYPPPPARAEVVPPQPAKNARWADGAWSWVAGGWLWTPGRWVVVPPGVHRAHWGLVRAQDGRLFLAPASWRDSRGRSVPEPRALSVASPVPG
jgi:hypothetical protein